MSADEPPHPRVTAPDAGTGTDAAPSAAKAPGPHGRFRWRRWVSPVLIVVATIVLFVSVMAVWIDYSVLDSEEFSDTVTEVIADPQVQPILANYLVDQIFSSVDYRATLEEALPAPLNRLVGPVRSALEEVAVRAATRLLASQEFQTLFGEAVRLANQQFVTVVEGDAAAIETIDGKVILDLQPMTQRLFERLGLSTETLTRLPVGAGQIVIMDESKLTAVQKLVDTLQAVAKWFWAIALVLYALAVWMARGRRREALRGVAFSFLVVGLGLLAIVRLGGPRLVETLVAVPENQGAAQSVWNILTANLKDSGRVLALIGLFMLAGTWLAGQGRRAVAIRSWLAPRVADRPGLLFGGVFVAALLVLAFGPSRENRSFFSVLIVLAFLALGVEVLRRLMLREQAVAQPAADESSAPPGS
jgi:hypothetical protein